MRLFVRTCVHMFMCVYMSTVTVTPVKAILSHTSIGVLSDLIDIFEQYKYNSVKSV